MSTHPEINTAARAWPQASRRKLLLGLPGGVGLALMAPLGLVGCGGGSDEAAATTTETADPALEARVQSLNSRLSAAERRAQPLTVELPAGARATLAGARLLTAHNQAEVHPAGHSAAVLLAGGAQMSYVVDAAGELLLLGLVEPGGAARVDARSTAEALILAASDVAAHTPALQLALRKTLRTHALVEPVERAVQAALARGPLSESDTALAAAVNAALTRLRPSRAAPAEGSGRARRQSARVWEAGGGYNAASARSGVWFDITADYNTVRASNRFRRRAHVWIDRLQVRQADGSTVESRARLTDFALRPTTAASFDSLVIAVGDFYARLAQDIGFLDFYESDPAVWSPVSSEPVTLPVEPGNAVASIYTARVVGPGAAAGEFSLTAEESARLDAIWEATLREDIVTPFIRNIVAPWLTDFVVSRNPQAFEAMSQELLAWFISDLTSSAVGRSFFPNTWAAIQNGDLFGAAVHIGSEFLNSSSFQVLLHRSLAALARAYGPIDPVAVGSGANIQVNLAGAPDTLAAGLSRAMTKFARIVNVIKTGATVGDYAAMTRDWNASSRLEILYLEATRARLRLHPDPLVIAEDPGARATITASLEGLDASIPAQDVFIAWRCTGRYGYLIKVGGNNDVNEFESTLAQPAHHYFRSGPLPPDGEGDTISATAFYRNPATNQRVEIGWATVPVQVKKAFTLAISPGNGTELPTDATLPVHALIKEVLPAGATVAWTWTHGGVGSITAQAADNIPSDSAVNFASGSSEGMANVSVRATVQLPAAGGAPARTVECDAVRASLHVKQGLRQVVMEVSGGDFACTDPRACGVSAYTAWLVPRLPKALRYSAVLTGFSYAGCNRSVGWNDGEVVRDRGDCNFPVTFHPHSSAGPTPTYAVWNGFGGGAMPAGARCVVTITLGP